LIYASQVVPFLAHGSRCRTCRRSRPGHCNPLLISGAEGPPAYPGVVGHKPDVARARREAAIGNAIDEVRCLILNNGSYLAESNFFEKAWQHSF
jgi:hypothetical protein